MKRLFALALTAVLVLTMSGCAALFDKELYSEEPYEAPSEAQYTEEDAADPISNYAALRRAITRLVSDHVESAELQFQNYDGSISQDISTACWEVKSSTALGAFAVDYISYDLSRIVSYYQAEIYITYKRSEHQLSALERVGTLSAMRSRLEEAMRAGETYLALALTAASAAPSAVTESLTRAYYADPLACPVLPAAEAVVYPESGVDRILEITLDYGMDGESLSQRRAELADALAAMTAACQQPAPAEEPETEPDEAEADTDPAEEPAEETAAPEPAALMEALCVYLAENCVVDETAGATAWDALVAKTASSEGVAMAFEAGCQALGLTCQLVSGRLDGEPHAWNIVTIGEASYHVDVSTWGENEENVFLLGDEDIWGGYWWDTSEYPVCSRRYGASEELASDELASGEPETSEEPYAG